MKVFGKGEILRLAQDTQREKLPELTVQEVLLQILLEAAEALYLESKMTAGDISDEVRNYLQDSPH